MHMQKIFRSFFNEVKFIIDIALNSYQGYQEVIHFKAKVVQKCISTSIVNSLILYTIILAYSCRSSIAVRKNLSKAK